MAFIGAFLVGIGAAITGGALTGIAAGIVGAVVVAAVVGAAAMTLMGGAEKGIEGNISIADNLGSPAYSFGKLVTQTNSSLVIPTIYGNVKVAGNIIYQEGTTVLKRLTSFCMGQILNFTDIRLNDLEISTIGGATYKIYTGDGTQEIDSRVPGSTQEDKAAIVGGLKYEAYIACSVTANDQINGDFNITTLCSGKLVDVYDHWIQIDGGSDMLIWDTDTPIRLERGNIFYEWSQNPAYCLLDLLTAYEGLGMSIDDIDIDSFVDTARYCDYEVDGQNRFTLNIVIDQKKSALGWIAEICKASQSIFGKRGDKWFMIADKAEDTTSVLIFTKDHINELASWFLPMEETYDVININYKDADYQWTYVQARAEADVYLRNDYPLVSTFDVFGCTNFKQASRLAWFYLNQAITTPMFVSFKTSKRGLNLTVGDIIAIDDYIYGFSGHYYRVLTLEEAQNSQIQIIAREYNENLYTDTAGSVAPTINFIQNDYDGLYLEDFSGLFIYENLVDDEYLILE